MMRILQMFFLDGYYVRGLTVTPVKVWRGEDGKNTHCTNKHSYGKLGESKVIKNKSIYISKKNRISGSFLKSTGIVEGVIWN